MIPPRHDMQGGVGVYVANPDGGDEKEILYVGRGEELPFPDELLWSRDGKRLAIRFGKIAGWLIVSAGGSDERRMSWDEFMSPEVYDDLSPMVSPDGTRRIWPLIDGGWVVASADTTMADVQGLPAVINWPSQALAWSPDGYNNSSHPKSDRRTVSLHPNGDDRPISNPDSVADCHA